MSRSTVVVHCPDGSTLEFGVDRRGDVPIYLQLFEQIKHYIATGRLKSGGELPSVRTLASALGISTVTVGRAIEALRGRGLVESIAGDGVYVVDFTRNVRRGGGDAAARDFAELVLRQAAAAGIETDTFVRIVQELAASSLRPGNPRRIVVIDEFDSVEVEVEGLQRSLADLDVQISGVRLADLDESIHLIDRAATILSAPHCYGLVRQRLSHRAADVLGLTLTLDPQVLAELRELPSDSRVALVATTPSFLGWMYYAVGGQVLLDTKPVEVAATNRRALLKAVAEAEVVVYGSGCRNEVPGLVPEEVRAIELRHVVDAGSVAEIRERLADLAARADGRAPR